MMQRIRFRSLDEAEAGERVLERVVTVTVLPGGHLAVPALQLETARQALSQAGIDFRDEPVEGYLAGRVIEEERDEDLPHHGW
ncbi:MAG TPA: hypothetical protein VEQ11_18695 [Chloroflexota bacterium]|nr:hypothetical protein [Chloroflexota bacterium]